MLIWVCRMTKAILAYVLAMLPAAVMAGAWDEFEARCLLPFENLFPVIVDGLDRQISISELAVFDLTVGEKLVIELVPQDGELACGVHGADQSDAQALRNRMTAGNRNYVPQGADVWASDEWIEPQLRVSVERDADDFILRVIETDLES